MFNNHFFLRFKRKYFPFLSKFQSVFIILAFVLLLFGLYRFALPQVLQLISPKIILNLAAKNSTSIRQDNNQVNILMMGIGGGNHEGPTLTDSIILAHLNLTSKKVSFVPLPRDIWVENAKAKINAIYETGEEKKKGTGLILTKATVAELLGAPVHYALLIDFDAFQKIIDLLGGIEVNVENTFDDFAYPIEGKEDDLCGKTEEELKELEVTDQNVLEIFPCRFEHLHFDKGIQTLGGTEALKFVRSRHASGDEGTDFARSKRQIKIITAVKNKLTKPEVFLNPSYLVKMSEELKGNLFTDLGVDQLIYLGKDFISTDLSSVKTLSLDIGTEDKPGLLTNPPWSQYGSYVLVPTAGDWKEIQEKIGELFNTQK
ncbi:MAG: cell envelope-related transcriptional attenuator [uncultured bacterium]|nr:MAG: cell envelope-related transcriptional attenuator [uncultured bacterium]